MKQFIRQFVVAIAGFAAGCNTAAGFGKDVAKLGGKIEQKAKN